MQLAMDGETTGPVIIGALQTEHAAIGNHSIRDEVAEGLRSPAAGLVTGQKVWDAQVQGPKPLRSIVCSGLPSVRRKMQVCF